MKFHLVVFYGNKLSIVAYLRLSNKTIKVEIYDFFLSRAFVPGLQSMALQTLLSTPVLSCGQKIVEPYHPLSPSCMNLEQLIEQNEIVLLL